ncbi:MAG: iron ABC transporter permease [Rhodobacteraceae bacterium]|nr:iron ABC transporter permease [Paracoccaceae bacterium]
MNAKVLALMLWLLPVPVLAQGFANLGTAAEGYAIPQRGTEFEFPTDHGPHPEFRIEWWYLTATLTGDDGRDYGVQWTLFRSALKPEETHGWDSPQLWMGHAGLTTPNQHYVAERLSRGGIGQAGVRATPFDAWIDNWQMKARSPDGIGSLMVTAGDHNFSYELALEAQGPLIRHGDNGYSVKSPKGQASYYYSQPFYRVTGTLQFPDRTINVTGRGWLDREWSSQPLAENQTGWDWFSLSFDTGDKLMGFRLRDDSDGFTSGTWISADGRATPLAPNQLKPRTLRTEQVQGRAVPVEWQLELPAHDLSVTVQAMNPQSWMETSFPYWEGPVVVSGTHSGRGYLEMTGY